MYARICSSTHTSPLFSASKSEAEQTKPAAAIPDLAKRDDKDAVEETLPPRELIPAACF